MAPHIVHTPARFCDLKGRKFGRLLVLGLGEYRNRVYFWECLCDCGKTTLTRTTSLLRGDSISCGCYAREQTVARSTTHGMSSTSEYRIWRTMQSRCYNQNVPEYARYGGRGIMVCRRWHGKTGFINFIADMGLRPSKAHSIDRINNDGNYEPGNCRWATRAEQSANRKMTRWVEYKGERLPVSVLAQRLGIGTGVLCYRLDIGLTIEEAIARPIRKRKRHFLELNGESLTVPEWAKKTGLSENLIRLRISLGWPVEKILGPHCHRRQETLEDLEALVAECGTMRAAGAKLGMTKMAFKQLLRTRRRAAK